MKKLILLLSFLFLMPSSVLADETINNGDTITPVGTISVYAGIESDSQLEDRGYLVANGATLSKNEYRELYHVIRDTYNLEGTDSDHFNLPNLSGRTVVGMDSTDSDFSTLGKKGGEKTVTLTVNQIPSHTHTFTGTASTTSANSNTHTHTFSGTTSSNGAHTHAFSAGGYAIVISSTTNSSNLTENYGFKTQANGGWWWNHNKNNSAIAQNGAHTHTFSGTTSGASTTHTHTFKPTGTNAQTGGSQAHNNMQPYIALKYIIKYK